MARLSAEAINVGPTVFCARVRGHGVFADVGEDMGGHDVAPRPPELLCAALANCIGMIVAVTCRNKGVDYEGMSVSVSAEPYEDESRLDDFKVTISLPGDLDERERKIVLNASTLSKVRGTISHGAALEVELA